VSKLTAKQEMFCREYIIDLNATQAAIRAGYSKKTAKDIGCQNLAKLNIAEFIQSLKEDREEKLEINADWVLAQAVKVHERCMQEEQVTDSQGMTTGEFKFEHSGANKSLELIGKHTSIKCFTDKVEVAAPEGITFINHYGGKESKSNQKN
jgi:phage terminase small subunit